MIISPFFDWMGLTMGWNVNSWVCRLIFIFPLLFCFSLSDRSPKVQCKRTVRDIVLYRQGKTTKGYLIKSFSFQTASFKIHIHLNIPNRANHTSVPHTMNAGRTFIACQCFDIFQHQIVHTFSRLVTSFNKRYDYYKQQGKQYNNLFHIKTDF